MRIFAQERANCSDIYIRDIYIRVHVVDSVIDSVGVGDVVYVYKLESQVYALGTCTTLHDRLLTVLFAVFFAVLESATEVRSVGHTDGPVAAQKLRKPAFRANTCPTVLPRTEPKQDLSEHRPTYANMPPIPPQHVGWGGYVSYPEEPATEVEW